MNIKSDSMGSMQIQALEGIALDWVVASAGGGRGKPRAFVEGHALGMFNYSTNWAQGGPIIEREGIEILCNLTRSEAEKFQNGRSYWLACSHRKKHIHFYGDTPLKAAMRAYCAKYFGDSVAIPAAILKLLVV